MKLNESYFIENFANAFNQKYKNNNSNFELQRIMSLIITPMIFYLL